MASCNAAFGSSTTLNSEGRLLAVYFEAFTLLNVYSPNSKSDLARLKERAGWWELALQLWVKRLGTGLYKTSSGVPSGDGKDELKSEVTTIRREVIVVGDLNVIPTRLDQHAPAYTACATQEEKQAFNSLLEKCDLTDAFRALHPTERKWSWTPPYAWGKIGCRLDFTLVSPELAVQVKRADVIAHSGSDHCPVVLEW